MYFGLTLMNFKKKKIKQKRTEKLNKVKKKYWQDHYQWEKKFIYSETLWCAYILIHMEPLQVVVKVYHRVNVYCIYSKQSIVVEVGVSLMAKFQIMTELDYG